MKCFELEYDVVLSFAGEDRKYVEQTAKYLKNKGVKVFYDDYHTVDLWGKDLYQHLDNVYQKKGKYAVIFISEAYSRKLWTNHELKSAQARAFSENEEYILPVRFDETEIPGIRKTIGYLSLNNLKPSDLAKKIIEKLGEIEPENYLPKNTPFIVSVMTSVYEDFSKDEIKNCIYYVFDLLIKTTSQERLFLSELVVNACKHNIDEDLHIDIKMMQRVTSLSREQIIEILNNLYSLGFEYKIALSDSDCEILGSKVKTENLSLSLISRSIDLELTNLTSIFTTMYLGVLLNRCSTCAQKALNRLDFTDLEDNISESDLEHIQSCFEYNED